MKSYEKLTRGVYGSAMIAAIVLVALFFTVPQPPLAVAQSGGMPITGFAWAGGPPSGMGWISFDGLNYGVFEDKGTGELSGYAWSSNIGWISFNAGELSGCPSGACSAEVDLSTGQVHGWARACAAFQDKNVCSGALDPNSGGWDGFISLSGSSYGVTQAADCTWSGFAWGSSPIGWISMSGPSYGVTGNDPLACSGLSASLTAAPDTIPSGQSSTLTWSSNGASSCVGSGFDTGGATSGSASTGPLVDTTSYQVSCTNGSDPVSAIATVTVLVPQADTFTLSATRVPRGTNTIDITWRASGVNSCDIYRGTDLIFSILADVSTHIAEGAYTDTADITGQTTYRLDCDGTTIATQIVNVVQSFQEF